MEERRRSGERRRAEEPRRRRAVSRVDEETLQNQKAKARRRKKRRGHGFSRVIGVLMVIAQFVLSVVLLMNVLFFNILTPTYVLVLVGVLLILLGITLLTQLGAKGRGIAGKVVCLVICGALVMGSSYISKVNTAFQKVTGSNKKTNAMVVVVKADDKADNIKSAADYTFGVQYATGADQTNSIVKLIQQEVGKEITLKEYGSVMDTVNGLYAGEVNAIIYNSAQDAAILEQHENYNDETKSIYTHNIVIEIENEAVNQDVTEPFAIYLSGIDTWGDITTTSRSDVNIIGVVNPKSHQVLLITTPRDYYVPIPEISNGQCDKLTHAGIYGVDASMRTLAELYQVDIKFFGRINFTSMEMIVDALGGLEVYSDETFTTSEDAGYVVDIVEGMNYLTGEEALAFCRERHALADGDNARGRHQQAVITAMIKKLLSPAMLRGATDIINSVAWGVDTNFTTDQIQALVKTQLRTNANWNIMSVAAQGYGARDVCYSSGSQVLYVTMPDEDSVNEIRDLINRVWNGEVLEGSESTQ